MKTVKTWLWIILSLQSLAFADPKKEPVPNKDFEVSEKEVKLPGVTVNRETSEVRVEATVCLKSGILEYLVCKPNTFEHEAIFTTTTKPELIHAALLLSGVTPTPLPRNFPGLWFEKALKQKNSRVTIEAEWKKEGKMKRVNLTEMLQSREDIEDLTDEDAPAKKIEDAWVFTGSFLHTDEKTGKRAYTANFSGIIVGIWPDPSTVIQYGIENGNPYEGKNLGIEINEAKVPDVGTKVNLIFSKFAPPAKKEKAPKDAK